MLPAAHPHRLPFPSRPLLRRLVVLAALFLACGAGPLFGESLRSLGTGIVAAAGEDPDGAADSDDGCDCAGDEMDADCSSGCAACPWCPAASSPASSPPDPTPVFAGATAGVVVPLPVDGIEDGPRRRLFRPPRSSAA